MTAEEIVHALAETSPTYLDQDGVIMCALCGVEFQREGPTPDNVPQHEPDCPWRMADEWIRESPASGEKRGS